MTFGKIFIKSYLEHNKEDCNYIFILDTGLKKEDRDYLNTFDKVKIVGSDVCTSFTGNASSDWTQTVVAKTYGLREILLSYDVTPLIMIDSDCLVLNKLNPLINMKNDLQICHRKNHITPMLGSYVCFNQKNINFLNDWIKTIPTISTPWKESPALSQIYNVYKDKLAIDLIDESIVSCIEKAHITGQTRIVHFKSGSIYKTIEEAIQKRIFERGYSTEVKHYLDD